MPISIPCPGCKAKLKAPEAAAGHTLKCPGCKTPVQIPSLTAAPRPAPQPAPRPPAPGTIQKAAPTNPAPPPKPAPRPMNLELPDDPGLLPDDPGLLPDDPGLAPLKPETPKKKSPEPDDEEVFSDFEVVDDDASDFEVVEDEPEEEEAEEIEEIVELPEVAEDNLDEIEEEGEPLDHLEEIVEKPRKAKPQQRSRPAEDHDELEEIEEEPLEVVPAGGGPLSWSNMLQLSLIHIKAHKSTFVETIAKMDNAGYNLVDPDAGKKVGEALEIRGTGATLMRQFVGRSLMTTKVELTEGRDRELLAVLRRPPYLWGSSIEILDADERCLGIYQQSPWSRLMQKPLYVTNKKERKILKIQPYAWQGRMVCTTPAGHKIGEMMTESAFEKKIKIYWFTKGMNYYVSFHRDSEGLLKERLLFLCVALGMDLLTMEAMSR